MRTYSIIRSMGKELSQREFPHIQPQTEQESDDSFQEMPLLLVNGVKTRIIGVIHKVENYFNHETKYKGAVANSPFVVLEYFEDYYFSKSTPDTSDETLLAAGKSDSPTGFYCAIARECARQGKDIYVVNPLADGVGSIVPQLVELALYAYFAANMFRLQNLTTHLLDNQLTRREFVCLLALGFSGHSLLTLADRLVQSATRNGYPGNPLKLDRIDFRDLLSAKRYELLTAGNAHSIGNQEIIPVIHGRGHTPGFIRYLEHPVLADVKINGYRHLEPLANPTRKYIFNSQINQWEGDKERS